MTLATLGDSEIICTFLALGLLLAGAYVCGKIMECIKAPKVIEEIIKIWDFFLILKLMEISWPFLSY